MSSCQQVYSGGLDNNINVWDLRKMEQSMSLTGHTDSITGLSLNPKGTHLLSNAVDNSLRVWDMRPYAPANRCEKIFTGHMHNFERNLLRCSWSSDGSKVCCNSHDAQCMVYIEVFCRAHHCHHHHMVNMHTSISSNMQTGIALKTQVLRIACLPGSDQPAGDSWQC